MSSRNLYLILTQLSFIGEEPMLKAGDWSTQDHTASDPVPCLDALPMSHLVPEFLAEARSG